MRWRRRRVRGEAADRRPPAATTSPASRVFPIVVLFLLNAGRRVRHADLRASSAPRSPTTSTSASGSFGTITLLVILLVPFVSVPGRRISPTAASACRSPSRGAAAWGAFSIADRPRAVARLLVIASASARASARSSTSRCTAALIADFYSPKARVKAFGLHSLANPAGATVGAILAGVHRRAFGWRAPFFVLAIPTVVVADRRARVSPSRERGRFEVTGATTAPPLRETAAPAVGGPVAALPVDRRRVHVRRSVLGVGDPRAVLPRGRVRRRARPARRASSASAPRSRSSASV